MKTQILRLEPHDDVISARDKMEWSQTGRILLVWPNRGTILNRRIDLVLLQRHSQSLGAQLAVITRDPQVCYHADELGIPVYKDLRQAQKTHWRINRSIRRKKGVLPPSVRSHPADLDEMRRQAHPSLPQWLSSPVTRIAAFALSILALLSIAAVIVPAAEITLTPQSQIQQITLGVRIDPEIDTINLSGAIPSRTVSIVLDGEQDTPAEGFSSVPDQAATVDILIANLTDEPLSIPAGTVIRTPGDQPKRFSISQAAQVPAGVGQSVSLPAKALLPGADGNIRAESLTIIEGSLGTRLSAINPMPASGGSNRRSPAPLGSQREQLYRQLIEQLYQQAIQELSQQMQPGDILLTPTLTFTQVIREVYDPPEGQPADQLNLALTLDFEAQVASDEDLRSLAKGALDANLPEGYRAVPDTISVEIVNNPEIRSGEGVSWRIRATQQIQADIEEATAQSLIRGLSPALANEKLVASLPLENTPAIRVIPNWWPRLPLLPYRMSVNFR